MEPEPPVDRHVFPQAALVSPITEDTPCPECRYNLRGLVNPRCPECGCAFDWTDVPSFRAPPQSARHPAAVVFLTWFVGLVLLLALTEVEAAFVFVGTACVVVAPFLVSFVHAAFETALVWPVIGKSNRRRFRAWWEGVLIGHGAAAATVFLFGYGIVPGMSDGPADMVLAHWPVMLLTTAEAVAIQWWVLRRRGRDWPDAAVPRFLLPACAFAKLLTGAIWAFAPIILTPV